MRDVDKPSSHISYGRRAAHDFLGRLDQHTRPKVMINNGLGSFQITVILQEGVITTSK